MLLAGSRRPFNSSRATETMRTSHDHVGVSALTIVLNRIAFPTFGHTASPAATQLYSFPSARSCPTYAKQAGCQLLPMISSKPTGSPSANESIFVFSSRAASVLALEVENRQSQWSGSRLFSLTIAQLPALVMFNALSGRNIYHAICRCSTYRMRSADVEHDSTSIAIYVSHAH